MEILDSKRVPITSKNRVPGPYPYYGANGIQDYVADYIFDDELVLLAEDGGFFGSKEKPIAYKVSGKCWVNNHAHVLKPKQGYLTDYICYSLMFYDTSKIISGSTRGKLTQASMKKMFIKDRPYCEQAYIVSKMNSVENVLYTLDQFNLMIEQLIKSRFNEMFSRGDAIHTTLGHICKLINGDRGKGYPSGTDFATEGIPFINAGHLENNYISFDKMNYITSEKFDSLNSGKVQPDDVLYCLRGSLGKTAIAHIAKGAIASSLLIIRPNQEMILPKYLIECLNSETVKRQVLSANNGSSQPNLSATSVSKFRIPLPTLALQQEFANFVSRVDKLRFKVQQQINQLEQLKQSVMQEYFG